MEASRQTSASQPLMRVLRLRCANHMFVFPTLCGSAHSMSDHHPTLPSHDLFTTYDF